MEIKPNIDYFPPDFILDKVNEGRRIFLISKILETEKNFVRVEELPPSKLFILPSSLADEEVVFFIINGLGDANFDKISTFMVSQNDFFLKKSTYKSLTIANNSIDNLRFLYFTSTQKEKLTRQNPVPEVNYSQEKAPSYGKRPIAPRSMPPRSVAAYGRAQYSIAPKSVFYPKIKGISKSKPKKHLDTKSYIFLGIVLLILGIFVYYIFNDNSKEAMFSNSFKGIFKVYGK